MPRAHFPRKVLTHMTNFPVRASLLLICLLVVGCHPSPPSLVGIYSADDQGKRVEYLRIEQKNDKFFASETKGDAWRNPQEVNPLGKADFEKACKTSVDGDVVGMGTNQAAIYRVPKGWKLGGFESKTGYVFLTLFGPQELHKDGE